MTLSTRSTQSETYIDLTDAIGDITDNCIYGTQYNDLPSDIFQSVALQAINELIDDFACNPDKYLKPHHQSKIDQIAQEYLES